MVKHWPQEAGECTEIEGDLWNFERWLRNGVAVHDSVSIGVNEVISLMRNDMY